MPIPIPKGLNFQIQHNSYGRAGNMPGMLSAKDHYTIGYVISGDRKSITTFDMKEQHAGQIGMLPPGVLHRTVSISDVPYERILIKYTYDMAEPFINLVGKSVFDQLYDEHIHSFPSDIQKRICGMMLDMVAEFEHYDQFSECILQGMLTRLLITIMKERIPSEYETITFPYENEQIMQALYYIEQNYNKNISIKDVADYVNLSPSYFSSLFKKIMGTPFTQHLINVRLQRSLLLLTSGSFKITEIAERCGFSTSNYFCDSFRKRFSCSPSSYQKYQIKS